MKKEAKHTPGPILNEGDKRKIEITCWRSGRVLFEHEAENNTMRLTVEAAVKAGVDLAWANLEDADLAWANLIGAKLAHANLAEANLAGARLYGADLTDANLECANLTGASLDDTNLAGASLAWADLTGANLVGANLGGAILAIANLARAILARANLARANLADAGLARANLARADLAGANLSGANLAGADLTWANLDGASLDGGEKLTGRRPILQVGPIGSASRYLIAYLTDRGLRLRSGCFFGSREQFEAKLADTHGDNEHAEEYRAALALIEAHERLWMPDEEASDSARAIEQEC